MKQEYNFELTRADLERRRGSKAQRGGGELRSSCPVCDGDNPTELRADLESGWWRCFKCGAIGKLQDSEYHHKGAIEFSRGRVSQVERLDQRWMREVRTGNPTSQDLDEIARGLQPLEPGYPVEGYLRQRGIPLAAARACGVRWRMGWPGGGNFARVVFPLTDANGMVVNYYGRAFLPHPGTSPTLSTSLASLRGSENRTGSVSILEFKHRYGRGPKGYWNGQMAGIASEVWLTEGAFNAVSLYAAGVLAPDDQNRAALSLGGAADFRPEWFARARRMVCLFDRDTAGQRAYSHVAAWALSRGLECVNLSPLLDPYNDVNEFLVVEGPDAMRDRLRLKRE